MTNKKQLINKYKLSNKDLKNIAKMLDGFYYLAKKRHNNKWDGTGIKVKDQYVKNMLDHNYNYSTIVNYLNDVAIPLIDDILDQPNDETSLTITYETH